MNEAKLRWNLVETAWELAVSSNIVSVNYDNKNKLFIQSDKIRRKNITTARGALNVYQKGKRFHCFDDIIFETNSQQLCDAIHFFPHTFNQC